MSKKSKKDKLQEEVINEAIETAESTDTPEVVEDVKAKKEKKSGNTTGLKVAKVILYALTFPVIVLLSLLICLNIGDGVSFYSFWPYVPVIIVGLFAIIFFIVALVVNRKKSKRSIMQKTASLLICCIVLTGGFGLLMDIVFPDVISMATSNTLFVEDIYNYHDSIEQAEYNKSLVRQFIRLNLLNGNYDGELSYQKLSEKNGSTYVWVQPDDPENFEKSIQGIYQSYYDMETEAIIAKIDGLNDLNKELYEWIYNNYVLTDYDYALLTDVGIDQRRAFCLALVDTLSDEYARLCEEGVKTSGLGAIATSGNEKMSWLFNNNYASMNQDGYNPFNDDCGLAYATSNRMTIPVVIRIILNDGYSATQPNYNGSTLEGYTMEVGVVDADGNFSTDTLDGYLAYLYKPEISEEYVASGGVYDANGKSEAMFAASDGACYYVYEDGHVETYIKWCVLDMLGDPMAIAGLDIAGLLAGTSFGGAYGTLMSLISQNSDKFESLLDGGLTNVIVTATDGQKLSLKLYFDDDGLLQIVLVPEGISLGYMGYQWMTWMQSGNLLVTVCGVLSLRDLLYIFGAVSIVLIVAVGILNEAIARKKKAAENEEDAQEEEPFPDEVLEETSSDEVFDEISTIV